MITASSAHWALERLKSELISYLGKEEIDKINQAVAEAIKCRNFHFHLEKMEDDDKCRSRTMLMIILGYGQDNLCGADPNDKFIHYSFRP